MMREIDVLYGTSIPSRVKQSFDVFHEGKIVQDRRQVTLRCRDSQSSESSRWMSENSSDVSDVRVHPFCTVDVANQR